MKRQWDIEDLIEHFTLVEDDLKILANKTGATRLGCALLLKCFQLEGHFPNARHEIPRSVVDYVAHQLIPIPFLCDRIKENTRKHMWKGMNIIHGTSNHPSGLPSVSG